MEIDVLIGCEESGIVTKAFRAKGINAWSCDLLPTSGNLPQYHIQGYVIKVIDQHPEIKTGIFFPPCTHLSNVGVKYWAEKQKDGRQKEAIDFFMTLYNAPIGKIAIENPVGILNTIFRKPDQIINPTDFGDPYLKRTCLWLRGLPILLPVTVMKPIAYWVSSSTKSKMKMKALYNNAKNRGRSFPGIAKNMAKQWGLRK